MASRKLSDADKQQILDLYRSSGETAASLSNRYGVSNSTISRLLKTELPEAEYEALIQQKRGRSPVETAAATPVAIPEPPTVEIPEPVIAKPVIEPKPVIEAKAVIEPQPEPAPEADSAGRRVRKRSSVAAVPQKESLVEPEPQVVPPPLPITGSMPAIDHLPLETPPVEEPPTPSPLPLPIPKARLVIGAPKSTPTPATSNGFAENNSVLEEILEEEILEEEIEDEDDLDDDLDDLDDEEGEDGDDEPLAEGALLVNRQGKSSVRIQVLPLTDASIPRTCYLVVDRSAELIARPLKEFGDLGAIPDEETLAKTLPVFDNHRVAKRYSNPRTQRVIKLPDGKILQRTSSHLQAKGITRLLIDGQVYALTGQD